MLFGAALGCGSSSSAPAPSSSSTPLPQLLVQRRADGRVEDERGPVEGALVVLTHQPYRPRGNVVPPHTITDGDGRWSVVDLEPGHYIFTASAGDRGIAKGTLDVAAYGSVTAPSLSLVKSDAAASIVGTVRGADLAPVAGALVVATAYQPRTESQHWSFATKTDARGQYRLVADRNQLLTTVFVDGQVLRWRSDRPYGSAPRRDFHLEPAATIEGRVVDEHGQPRADIWVTATSATEQGFHGADHPHYDDPVTQTDARGRFELRVRGGRNHVAAWGPHARTAAPVMVARAVGGTGDPVELTAYSGVTLTGTAHPVGSSGRVGRISATAEPSGASLPARPWPEPDGSFVIAGVPPGNYALHGGAASLRVTVGTEDIEGLALPMRTEEQPASAHPVTIQLSPPGTYLTAIYEADNPRLVPSWRHSELDGQVTLESIPSGRYMLIATRVDGLLAMEEIETGPKTTAIAVEATPHITVRGSVHDDQGRPQAGVVVVVSTDGAPGRWHRDIPTQLTDARGRYQLHGLTPGTYTLRVSNHQGPLPWANVSQRERWRAMPLECTRKDTTLTRDLVVIRAPTTLRGTVRDASGKPRAGVRVGVRHNPMGIDPVYEERSSTYFATAATTLTDDAGRFVVTGLEPGLHSLRALDPLDGAAGELADIAAGSSVSVPLHAPSTISVRIPGLGPTRSLWAEVVGPSAWSGNVLVNDGRLELGRLQPGEYGVAVSGAAGQGATHITTTAGSSTTLSLGLRPWARVQGQLVSAVDSRPIEGVTVRLEPLDSGAPMRSELSSLTDESAKTDREGRFTMYRVVAGARQLRVESARTSRLLRSEMKVEVEAGATADLGAVKARPPRGASFTEVPTGLSIRNTTWGFLEFANEGLGPAPAGIPEHDKRLYVDGVEPGSLAHATGFQVGDQVLAIDGLRVADIGHTAVANLIEYGAGEGGHTYTIELDRRGAVMTLRLVVPAT